MFNKKIKKVLLIDGMSCKHCSKRIEENLLLLEGIKKVKVDLDKKEATVTLERDVEDHIIKEKIENLGFTLIEIKNV